ncbi:hypothetical protein [Herbiconiux solani]|uniref:hypothetical protein n=1 Tax=Herbiconiux solani TaxID=661329 RepID=UPI001FE1788A|nr:hypothetical protein [Herbiconiux solani]
MRDHDLRGRGTRSDEHPERDDEEQREHGPGPIFSRQCPQPPGPAGAHDVIGP